MGALAGIYYRDDRPVAQHVLDTLCVGNTTYGPDRVCVHTGNGIALLAFALSFDNSSGAERQPIVSDHAVLAWDGRLDNREDFFIRSRLSSHEMRSDAQLIAEALERGRETTLREAVGDWTLVYWRSDSRNLLLACDHAGNRPLHYLEAADYFAWSTAIEALVDLAGLHTAASDTYFAGDLTFGAPRHHTPYRGVFIIPPGHALHVTKGHLTTRSYLGALQPTMVRYRDPMSYEEHYRALFTDAVRVRLRSNRPVAAELSGGYDSSSVTCVAAALTRAGSVEAPALVPVSVVTPDDPDADDTQYVTAVEAFCGVEGLHLDFHEERSVFELGPIDGESRPTVRTHFDLVIAAGCRTLLTGGFGDEVTATMPIADVLRTHLQSWHMGSFLRDSLEACRVRRKPLTKLWAECVRTVVDSPERRAGRHRAERLAELLAAKPQATSDAIARAFDLRPDFVARANLTTAPDPLPKLPHDLPPFARMVLAAALGGRLVGNNAPRPLAITHPFSHRPLVSYVLGLPPEILWTPNHPRAFVCNALQQALPQKILYRGSKQHATPIMFRTFHRIVTAELRRVARWQIVQRGYVEPTTLTHALSRFLSHAPARSTNVLAMLRAERTLRAMAARHIQAAPAVVSDASARVKTFSRREEVTFT
jgi:hypothetical protein